MANDFSQDENCVALWKFESGALGIDSKNGNDLMKILQTTKKVRAVLRLSELILIGCIGLMPICPVIFF